MRARARNIDAYLAALSEDKRAALAPGAEAGQGADRGNPGSLLNHGRRPGDTRSVRSAIYINLVEHPARLSCGTELAVTEFAPSYRRATLMQASLALVGLTAAIGAWVGSRDQWVLVAGLGLGAVVPFTLLVILPTNRRRLDPTLDPASAEAGDLLRHWGRLHAVRSVLSGGAFLLFLCRLATG